jgi:hypothetical protein
VPKVALLLLACAACGGAPFTMADPSAGDDASPILTALAPDAPILATDGGAPEASPLDVASETATATLPDAGDPPRRDGGHGASLDASPDSDPPDGGHDADPLDAPPPAVDAPVCVVSSCANVCGFAMSHCCTSQQGACGCILFPGPCT